MLKKSLIWWSLCLIIVVSSWSLFHAEFFRAHDYVHAARVAEMLRSLQEGQFPVRWTKNFGYGFGMPLFEFYAPLPYYVGAGLSWLGLNILLVLKILFITSTVVTVVGSYTLGAKLYGSTGGILTSAAIALAPYRAVNLFVRGALSEAWGIMALPWILYGLVTLIDDFFAKKTNSKGWWITTLALVVLMLSHNLTTLMFVPISFVTALAYGLFRYLPLRQQGRTPSAVFHLLGQLIGVYLLAVGMSAFYQFPALAEKGFTQIESILSGYFYYANHFLYIRQFFQSNWGYGGSEWGPNDGLSFYLGLGQIGGFIAAWVLLGFQFVKVFQKKHALKFSTVHWRKLSQLFVLSLILGGVLFLSLLRSKYLWDTIPVLTYIQFPWRWMSVGIIYLGLIVGFGVTLIHSKIMRLIYTGALLGLILLNGQYFHPESFLIQADDLYYTDEERIQTQMSGILPDFIPQQMDVDQLIQLSQQPVAGGQSVWCNLPECEAKLSLLLDRGHEKLIKTDFSVPTAVEFKVADFPGWQLELDGQKVPLCELPTELNCQQITPLGNIAVLVPEREHTVALQFQETSVRGLSDSLTAVSWFLFLLLCLPITKFQALITKEKHD